MKERKGFVFMRDGKPYARLQFTDENGNRRDLWRRAESPKHARQLLKDLIKEIESGGAKSIDASRMTFADLADYYQANYVRQAEYVDGRKIAGLRSLKSARSILNILRQAFGKRLLRAITYGVIERYKQERLKTPKGKGTRSIASVNRELSTLRRMFNIAVREGWLAKNPFNCGDSLVSLADERKRERILSHDEERRLLEACGERTVTYTRRGKQVTAQDKGERREHLRPIIIAALDTGCRLGELLKMRWRDVDSVAGVITIQAFNTKTMRERQVSITTRLSLELERLWEASDKNADALVFRYTHHVRRSFNGARRAAGLPDVRFHDLRHTHGSRLDDLGFSLAKIGSQLGHTQVQTTLRYVNRDKAAVRQVATALDAFNAEAEAQAPNAPELVN